MDDVQLVLQGQERIFPEYDSVDFRVHQRPFLGFHTRVTMCQLLLSYESTSPADMREVPPQTYLATMRYVGAKGSG
jgi:hypothetical protein